MCCGVYLDLVLCGFAWVFEIYFWDCYGFAVFRICFYCEVVVMGLLIFDFGFTLSGAFVLFCYLIFLGLWATLVFEVLFLVCIVICFDDLTVWGYLGWKFLWVFVCVVNLDFLVGFVLRVLLCLVAFVWCGY